MTQTKWAHTSASQIKKRRRCDSSWWLDKISDQKPEDRVSSEGAKVGKMLHLLAELYLLHGYAPKDSMQELLATKEEEGVVAVGKQLQALDIKDVDEFVSEGLETSIQLFEKRLKRAAAALVTGIHHLPKPPVDPGRVEKEISDCLPPTEKPFKGYIDLIDGAYFDEKAREVVILVTDHKSSSNIKEYGLAEQDLRNDAQTVIYLRAALELFTKGFFDDDLTTIGYWRNPYMPHQVHETENKGDAKLARDNLRFEFRHVYYQTSGSHRSSITKVRKRAEEIIEDFSTLVRDDVGAMLRISSLTRLEDVPHNLKACGDYGGCPFRSNCAAVGRPTSGMAGLFKNMGSKPETQTQEDQTMGLAERMAARKAAKESNQGTGQQPQDTKPSAPADPCPINPPDGVAAEEKTTIDQTFDPPTIPEKWSLPETLFDGELSSLAGQDPTKLKKADVRSAVERLITGIIEVTSEKEAVGSPDGWGYQPGFGIENKVKVDELRKEACRLLTIYDGLVGHQEIPEKETAAKEETKDQKPVKEETVEAPETSEAPVAKSETKPETIPPATIGSMLIVGGQLQSRQAVQVLTLDGLLEKHEEAVCSGYKVPHVLMVEFGKGPKEAAALLDIAIKKGGGIKPGTIIQSRFPNIEQEAIRVLSKYVDAIIFATR